jgi:hypothetical protein
MLWLEIRLEGHCFERKHLSHFLSFMSEILDFICTGEATRDYFSAHWDTTRGMV